MSDLTAVADTAAELLNESSVTDPSVGDILAVHSGQTEEDAKQYLREKMPYVRVVLHEKHDLEYAHLVTQQYYDEYRNDPPATLGEALNCIPIGEHAAGIRYPYGEEHDIIYQASLYQNIRALAGKGMKNFRVLREAVGEAKLSIDQFEENLQKADEAVTELKKCLDAMKHLGVSYPFTKQLPKSE